MTLEGPVEDRKDEQFPMRNAWMSCNSAAQQSDMIPVYKIITGMEKVSGD